MLVSAPAGFGKTTLLAEWLAGRSASTEDWSAAWLSLDRRDNDPATFGTCVVATLRTVRPRWARACSRCCRSRTRLCRRRS
jgi:LuxR family maltose regulon positive regulatory protein